MKYYLGVDIGTTSVKSVAFSGCGDVIASWSCDYKMYHPQTNYCEQDPEEIFQATLLSINTVVASLKNQSPEFVSFSSAMHALLSMNGQGQPLTRSIVWADNRAAGIAEELMHTGTGAGFYHATGVPVHAMSPLCKIIWFKQNEPDVFYQTDKFIGIKEYVFFRFFGVYAIDVSIASTTGLLSLNQLNWSDGILHYIGITPEKLSVLKEVHTSFIFNETCVAHTGLNLKPGTPCIMGGSDGALANLGTNAIQPNAMAISIGTSGAARVVVTQPQTDEKMRTFCYYLKNNFYILGGPGNNGAVVMQWLKDKLFETPETYQALFMKAGTVPPGCDGLLFLPYILGERAPVWDSNASGIYFGLTINHSKAHLIRAAMEGVMHGMYSIAEILFSKKNITEIYATGGFVQSPLWVQMLADMCNKTVWVSGAVESSALGAVIIGLEAMGIGKFPIKNILATYQPNPLNHQVYHQAFKKFEKIYTSFQGVTAVESIE